MITLIKITIALILNLLLAPCSYNLNCNSSTLSTNDNITKTEKHKNRQKLIPVTLSQKCLLSSSLKNVFQYEHTVTNTRINNKYSI